MSDLDIFPSAISRADNLVGEWNSDDSPRFYSLIIQKLILFDSIFLTPFKFASLQSSIYRFSSRYVLDYKIIGKRLGLNRPIFDSSLFVQYFGFSAEDGFDQGPFKSVDPIIGRNVEIYDNYYKLILHGRAKYIFSDGSIDEFEEMYSSIF